MQTGKRLRSIHLLGAILAAHCVVPGCALTPSLDSPDQPGVNPAGPDGNPPTADEPGSENFMLVASEADAASGTWDFSVQPAPGPDSSSDEFRFVWDFGDGLSAEGPVQSHVFAEPGTYVVRVSALRSDGSVAFVLSSEVVVSPGGNAPPTALAGDDQAVSENESVYLNAGGSFDTDQEALSFSWSQSSGPPVLLQNADQVTASFVSPLVNADTELTFTVRVSDGTSAAQDTTVVTIMNAVDPAGTEFAVNAGADLTVQEGAAVTLTSVVSGVTGEVTYEWAQLSGTPVALDGETEATVTFVAPLLADDSTEELEFRVQAAVLDRSAVDFVRVRLQPTPVPGPTDPPLSANAGPDVAIATGGSAMLTGGATGGAPPYSFRWSPSNGLNSTTIAQPTANPSSTTTYTLTVTDSAARTATDSVVVTVQAAASATIGVNVAKLYGWSPQIAFVDAFKQSRPFLSNNATGGTSDTGVVIPVDANGYPLQIPYSNGVNPPQVMRTIMLDVEAGSYPAGTYTLILVGDGDVELGGDATGTFSQTGGERSYPVSVPTPSTGVSLTIRRSNTANPLRIIRFVMPGHLSTYAAQPFYPAFLDRLRGFGAIRFMEWIRTNGQRRLVSWTDRPTTSYVTQAGPYGGAYEYAVWIGNEAGADPWLTIPHLADDGFVRELARLVLTELAPERRVYVEYSNELWNGMFSQTTYVRDTGVALGLGPDSVTAGRRYTAKRSAEIFKIFEDEFGAQRHRVVKVLAGQAGSASVASGILDAFRQTSINSVPVNPTGMTASALAIAPYFGNGLADQIVTNGEVNTITATEILNRAETIYLPQSLSRVATNKAVADSYGLPLISYEGGQHIVATGSNVNNTVLTQKLHAANRDPRMYDLYRLYLDGWRQNGGAMFVHYHYCDGYDQYGSWGLMEYLDQPLSEAPKYRALRDAMAP